MYNIFGTRNDSSRTKKALQIPKSNKLGLEQPVLTNLKAATIGGSYVNKRALEDVKNTLHNPNTPNGLKHNTNAPNGLKHNTNTPNGLKHPVKSVLKKDVLNRQPLKSAASNNNWMLSYEDLPSPSDFTECAIYEDTYEDIIPLEMQLTPARIRQMIFDYPIDEVPDPISEDNYDTFKQIETDCDLFANDFSCKFDDTSIFDYIPPCLEC